MAAVTVQKFFDDTWPTLRRPRRPFDADRHLPAVEDKERGWRARAGFSLDQVVTLTTDVRRIPEDRRAHSGSTSRARLSGTSRSARALPSST